MNINFETAKARRAIQKDGSIFTFAKRTLNAFGESDISTTAKVIAKGLFHIESVYVSVVSSTGTRSQRKPTPMIMFLHSDLQDKNTLGIDDEVEYNGKKYKVTGISNPGELNITLDVSLEVVQ